MATLPPSTDPAFSTALPVQVPGQQYGSVARLPRSVGGFVQSDVVDAARKQVQQSGSYIPGPVQNPIYTNNGTGNSYQEANLLPNGRPIPGPVNASSTNRAPSQGFHFAALTNPSVYNGSVSDNTPPPSGTTYITSR